MKKKQDCKGVFSDLKNVDGYVHEILDETDTASATGATGLTPTPPRDKSQEKSYKDL